MHGVLKASITVFVAKCLIACGNSGNTSRTKLGNKRGGEAGNDDTAVDFSGISSFSENSINVDQIHSGGFESGSNFHRPKMPDYVLTIYSSPEKIPDFEKLMKMVGLSTKIFSSKIKHQDGFEYASEPIPVLYAKRNLIPQTQLTNRWTVEEVNKGEKMFKISGFFHFTTNLLEKDQIFITAVFGPPGIQESEWNTGYSRNLLTVPEMTKIYNSYVSQCGNEETVIGKFLGDIWDHASVVFGGPERHTVNPMDFRAYIIIISDERL